MLADRHRTFTTPLTLGIDVSCPKVHLATSAPSGLRHAHHAWLGVKPSPLLTHRDRPNRLLPLEAAESPIVKASTRGSNYTYKGMNAGDQASCGWKAPGSTIAWGGVGALVFLPEALQITAACPVHLLNQAIPRPPPPCQQSTRVRALGLTVQAPLVPTCWDIVERCLPAVYPGPANHNRPSNELVHQGGALADYSCVAHKLHQAQNGEAYLPSPHTARLSAGPHPYQNPVPLVAMHALQRTHTSTYGTWTPTATATGVS